MLRAIRRFSASDQRVLAQVFRRIAEIEKGHGPAAAEAAIDELRKALIA